MGLFMLQQVLLVSIIFHVGTCQNGTLSVYKQCVICTEGGRHYYINIKGNAGPTCETINYPENNILIISELDKCKILNSNSESGDKQSDAVTSTGSMTSISTVIAVLEAIVIFGLVILVLFVHYRHRRIEAMKDGNMTRKNLPQNGTHPAHPDPAMSLTVD